MSKEAIKHYESALKEAFPSGATGDVFFHWNEARKALAEQTAQQEPVTIHQFRKRGCSDWYDGLPDHHDGHGPYEVRTLYTTPQAQPACEPLTDDQIGLLYKAWQAVGADLKGLKWSDFVEEIGLHEAEHGITKGGAA